MCIRGCLPLVTKPIPMKRELKGRSVALTSTPDIDVTKPIPMKRELKELFSYTGKLAFLTSQSQSR